MPSSRVLAPFLGILLIGGAARSADAQAWSAGVSAGQLRDEPTTAAIGTNNVNGTLRYDASDETWFAATAAAPLGPADTAWGSVETQLRLALPQAPSRPATAGVDLSGSGFLFRDPITRQSGSGGALGAMPFVQFSGRDVHLELRGGVRGYSLRYDSGTVQRGVLETGARLQYDAAVHVLLEGRWVDAPEGTFPYLGASVAYGGSKLSVSGSVGRWISNELDAGTWAVGASVALNRAASVWISVRQDAPEPLYWNPLRRTWSVGVTQRLGRRRAIAATATPEIGGDVTIRVPLADAPGAALSIAGDFNQWQPAPMTREGSDWVIRLPLQPGVYNYAFRDASGTWFVPASVAGRHDDGMGGEVAALVVR